MKSLKITKIVRADGSEPEDLALLQPIFHLMSAQRESLLRDVIPAFNYWQNVPVEVMEKVFYICELICESLYL